MQFGLSRRDAEWQRLHGAFRVLSASPQHAVISADGNEIAVEPAAGFCLSQKSIETSARSAFLVIDDCVLDGPAAGAVDLPPGMPGIITVSISGDPGLSEGDDLSGLETFLGTEDGRALLGRGGDGSKVSIVDTRRARNILYVLVDDEGGDAVPVLAPRFWRAFVELNRRLLVVTVSGFRDRPMEEDEMLSYLGDQVRQLQLANRVPADEPPVRLARAPRRAASLGAGSGDERDEDEAEGETGSRQDAVPPIPDIRPRTTGTPSGAAGQGNWPLPPPRRATTPVNPVERAGAGTWAPAFAPDAPRRRRR